MKPGISFPELLEFSKYSDKRGDLISLEGNVNIPFDIKRVYYIYNCDESPRGFHAHKNLTQLLICVSGHCEIILDDGETKVVVNLDNPNKGLVIESPIWREIRNFSENCVLLVLANDVYKESDYIRNYEDFIALVKS